MHDVIILTQNEAIGARQPPIAVAAPIVSFWVRIVTYGCKNIERGVLFPHNDDFEIEYRHFGAW